MLSLLLAVLGYKSPGGVSIQPRSLEVPPDKYQMAPAVSFGWPLYIPQYCLYWAQDCDTWLTWACELPPHTGYFPFSPAQPSLLHPHIHLLMEHCHTGLTLCLGSSEYLAS